MKEILNNVSLFWSKYFEDSEVLHSLIEGAISYISNLKQDNYSYLLSTGLDSIPLQLRQENILLELEDTNFLTITANSQDFLIYDLGNEVEYTYLPYIMGSPNATHFLENNVDFYLFRGDSDLIKEELSSELLSSNYYILFSSGDPRRPGDFSSVKFRKESEYVEGNYTLLGRNFPSNIPANTEIELLNITSEVIQKCRVALNDSTDSIFLHISTPVKNIDNINSFRILGQQTEYFIDSIQSFIYPNSKLQIWAPIVKKDTRLLQDLYSHTHSAIFSESTERYRNFLLGLNSIKTRPLSVESIKSSICLCANIPIFNSSYDEGDRIIRVDTSDRCTSVYTTIAKYEIPSGLTLDPRIIADAIELSNNDVTIETRPPNHLQTFFFKELQPLITDIQVNLGIDSDSWWNRGIDSPQFIEIPEGVMLNEELNRRVVINHEYENNIGSVDVLHNAKTYRLPPAAIGDYGIEIGDATRNTIAYTLFNDFLKHHTVFIELSEEFYSLPDFSEEVLSDFKNAVEDSCLPGSLIIIGTNMDALLEDLDGDSIPDIIDPEILAP